MNVDVTPNVSPAGEGRIGVQLEANAEMTKRVARNGRRALSRRRNSRERGGVQMLFSLVSDFVGEACVRVWSIAIVKGRR